MEQRGSRFEIVDVNFINKEYEGDNINSLVLLIQKGDSKAKDELYSRLMPELQKIARAASEKFSLYENDESFYFNIYYNCCETCIKNFNLEKGNFLNYWRRSCKKSRDFAIKDISRLNKPSHVNTIYSDDLNNEHYVKYFRYFYGDEQSILLDSQVEIKGYTREKSEAVLNFVLKHYGEMDMQIVKLWMESYSLKEISEIVNINLDTLTIRLYTLIRSVRCNFKTENYD